MRSIIAILLASVFLLQSVEKFFILVNYEVNKDYIAKNLCENKAKPMMHCNGKCHLRKQLQQQEKKENSTPNSIKEKFELQFFSETGSLIDYRVISELPAHIISYNAVPYSKHISSVFHPPQA